MPLNADLRRYDPRRIFRDAPDEERSPDGAAPPWPDATGTRL